MEEIIKIVVIILLTWFVSHNFLYSPKAQIKRLRNKMFLYKGVDYKKELEFEKISGKPSKFIKSDQKTQKLINALIDEYLDEEKDSDFIEQYKDKEFIS